MRVVLIFSSKKCISQNMNYKTRMAFFSLAGNRSCTWLAPGVHWRERWGHGPDLQVSMWPLVGQKWRWQTNNEGAGLCQPLLCRPQWQNQSVKMGGRGHNYHYNYKYFGDEWLAANYNHLLLVKNYSVSIPVSLSCHSIWNCHKDSQHRRCLHNRKHLDCAGRKESPF